MQTRSRALDSTVNIHTHTHARRQPTSTETAPKLKTAKENKTHGKEEKHTHTHSLVHETKVNECFVLLFQLLFLCGSYALSLSVSTTARIERLWRALASHNPLIPRSIQHNMRERCVSLAHTRSLRASVRSFTICRCFDVLASGHGQNTHRVKSTHTRTQKEKLLCTEEKVSAAHSRGRKNCRFGRCY